LTLRISDHYAEHPVGALSLCQFGAQYACSILPRATMTIALIGPASITTSCDKSLENLNINCFTEVAMGHACWRAALHDEQAKTRRHRGDVGFRVAAGACALRPKTINAGATVVHIKF
jgi:hypothetical protein